MVYVYIAEGTEEIEFITVVDILRRCGIDTVSVSTEGSSEVIGSHGIKLIADIVMDEADYDLCEMIVFPGGMPGTLNFAENSEIINIIEKFNREGRYIAAICAAPSVLGKAGVLKGRTATCYPGFEDSLIGANLAEDKVVIDKNIITSKGPGTAMEFALFLAETVGDRDKVLEVRKGLVY